MEIAKRFELYMTAVKKNDLNLTKQYFCDDFLHKLDENDMNGFLLASNLGHVDIVKFFLEKNVQIESPCRYNSWRALHWAVGNGYEQVGKLLIVHGADKDSKTSKGMSPLHCAAVANHLNAVRMLLGHGVDMNSQNNKGQTAMTMAQENECDETVELFQRWIAYDKIFDIVRHQQLVAFKHGFLCERVLLHEAGTNLTVLDVAVRSKAFHCLEFMMQQDMSEDDILAALATTLADLQMHQDEFRIQLRLYRSILLDRKRDFVESAKMWTVNRQWILTGQTFLEIASKHNRSPFVAAILQWLLVVDESWHTSIEVAKNLGHTAVAEMIMSRQAFVNNRTKASYNRLHIAVQDNNVDVIKYLLDNGSVDPDQSDAVLGTPLCLAFSLGHMESVVALRQYDIDVNKTNKFNQTPLHIAIESKMMQSALEFLDYTDDIDHKDCYGFTPLHLAVINNDEDLCGQLIERGADVSMPLHIQPTSHMNSLFMSAIMPFCTEENPITLCIKLHRMIMPSLSAKINHQICETPAPGSDGNSLLHLSSKLLIPEMTQMLITKGSHVNLQNVFGNTPLHSAFIESTDNSWEMEGFPETIHILVSRGADINLLNNAGISAFRCALNSNSRKTLNVVLGHCQRVDVTNDDIFSLYQRQWANSLKTVLDLQTHEFKRSLLIHYITESQLELIDFILEIAGDEFVKSIVDESLCIAGQLGREPIFDSLLPHYQHRLQLLPNGDTVLTSLISNAAESYSLKLCEATLDIGGDSLVDMKNQLSQTALHVAAMKGYLKLFKWLMINCQNIAEEYNGVTGLEMLVDTIGGSSDGKNIDRLEKIIKIMIKQGLDIYKIRDANCTIISKISNCALKSRLEKFSAKITSVAEENVDEEKYLCEICITNTVNCQFGCGHPFCQECANRVQFCPKCRKKITTRIPLYLN